MGGYVPGSCPQNFEARGLVSRLMLTCKIIAGILVPVRDIYTAQIAITRNTINQGTYRAFMDFCLHPDVYRVHSMVLEG
jgi:hypothetical protein